MEPRPDPAIPLDPDTRREIRDSARFTVAVSRAVRESSRRLRLRTEAARSNRAVLAATRPSLPTWETARVAASQPDELEEALFREAAERAGRGWRVATVDYGLGTGRPTEATVLFERV